MTKNAIWVMFTLAGLLAAQSAGDLFQQGLRKERSEGDYAAAIRLYERAVKAAGQDRKLAAQALLRMGECQERQGGESARKTYERLMKEYADQPQFVAEARTRIGAMSAPATSGPRLRQLWAERETDSEGGISPDGQFLTYPHWDTGDLGLRDLKNGTTKLLTNTGGYDKNGGQFNQDSIFSPDGKQIAYNWWIQINESKNLDGYEIRVMNADGTGVRTVAFQGNLTYVVPRAWSPDGRHLAVVHYDRERKASVVEVELATGKTRTIAELGTANSFGVAYSPDGRWLAHDALTWAGQGGSSIQVVSRESGARNEVVPSRVRGGFPIWSADGKWIYFGSERSGAYTLYRVAVGRGKAESEPESMQTEVGAKVVPLGRTRSGSFVYGKLAGDLDIYHATINPTTGAVEGTPKVVPETLGKTNRHPVYSRDGKQLAWFASLWSGQSSLLVVKDLASGQERKIEVPRPSTSGPCWAPDGRTIYFTVVNEDKSGRSIVAVDLATSSLAQIRTLPDQRGLSVPVVSQDGAKLYSSLWGEGGVTSILEIDLRGGKDRSVFTTARGATRINHLSVSPDGRTIYATQSKTQQGPDRVRRELLAIPVAGGEVKVIAGFESNGGDNVWAGGMALTPDGRFAIIKTELKGDVGRLLRIDLTNGKVEPLQFDARRRLGSFSLHPNGREIVFQAGEARSEIWVAENLFPPGH